MNYARGLGHARTLAVSFKMGTPRVARGRRLLPTSGGIRPVVYGSSDFRAEQPGSLGFSWDYNTLPIPRYDPLDCPPGTVRLGGNHLSMLSGTAWRLVRDFRASHRPPATGTRAFPTDLEPQVDRGANCGD